MGQGVSAHQLWLHGASLLKAAKADEADAAARLVSAHPQLLKRRTFHQSSAVHAAARHNNVAVLHVLIGKAEELQGELGRAWALSSSPGAPAAPAAATAAATAAAAAAAAPPPHGATASLVLQLVTAADDRGITPLMLAAGSGCLEAVALLLAKGADPWAADKLGNRTALHYATRSKSPRSCEIMRRLIDAAGATGPVHFPNRPSTKYVDVRTHTGFTAVHMAVHAGCAGVLAVLLRSGANPLLSTLFDSLDGINAPRGTTALHLAARCGNEAAARQLLKCYLERWAQRNLPDPRLLVDGDSHLPCHVAARREHEQLTRMLLPSVSLQAMFADGELEACGPPSLAAIAGLVLRRTLADDLQATRRQQAEAQSQQQQGKQGEGAEDGPRVARSISNASNTSTSSSSGGGTTLAAACVASQLQRAPAGKARLCSAARAGGAPPRDSAGGREHLGMHARERRQARLQAGGKAANAGRALDASGGGGDARAPAAATAAAAAAAGQAASCGSHAGLDALCGVCLDAAPQVALAPCSHELCIGCCQRLLALNSRCVMVCPFCRASVARLLPLGTLAAAAGTAADVRVRLDAAPAALPLAA